MEKELAIKVFQSLSSEIRLGIFRLLVREEPQGLVAGEVAEAMELAPNNASFHLKDLASSGLVTASQEGRFQRYRANLPLMADVVEYLTAECCAGSNKECRPLRRGAKRG